jgi:Carboxypeptidase regulatory-like domain
MKRAISVLLLLAAVMAVVLVAALRVKAAPHRKSRATLQGVVLGPNDRPVAHAAVIYQSSAGMAPRAVHTDSHGRFTIRNLYADDYDVRATYKSLFSDWEKNVVLYKGQTREITLRLIYARKMPKSMPPQSSEN